MKRFYVKEEGDFAYGYDIFISYFDTKPEAEAYAERQRKKWTSGVTFTVHDTIAEKRAEIATLKAKIAALEKEIEAIGA